MGVRMCACVCVCVSVRICTKSKFTRLFLCRSESKCIYECKPQACVFVCVHISVYG